MSKQKKDYSYWAAVIKAAVKYRDKIITADDFRTYSNYFKGRFAKSASKSDRVDVNMVYSTTMLMMSALASKDPWVAFKARKDEFKSRETVAEESLNNTFTDIGYRQTLQNVIRDAQLYGFGVGKCGYAFEADETKQKVDKQSEMPEYNLHIKKDTAYFSLVDPKKLLLDPTSLEGIKDSKFVIEVFTQRKSFLAEKYKIDLDKMSGGIPAYLQNQFDDMDKEAQKLFDMCIFYEIWDIIAKKRIIMIEGYTEKIFEYDFPYGLTEYPHEILIFNHSPNEPYGISDVSLYRTQQEELNVLRSTEAECVKKNNPKWQAVADGVELKEIKKFLNNNTGTVCGVKVPNAIAPIQTHTMPMDYSVYESRISNDIKETLGIADFMRGGSSGGSKKTATQSYSEDQFAKLRLGQRQNEVDNFVLRCANKIFSIMQNEYDTQRYVKVAGPNGQYISQEYTKKDIDGEFDKVIQQSSGAANRPYQAQMLMQASKFLLGNPLVSPKEFTDLIVDVYLDGLDTSKLITPDAEQIANDPIAREQWRQIMLQVSSGTMQAKAIESIKSAGQPIQGQALQNIPGQQMPGGSPTPGMPEQIPQQPSGNPPVGGV